MTRSPSRPASCRGICAKQNRSKNCYRGFTSRACPRAIFRGAGGAAGPECQGPVRQDRHAPESRLVAGLRGLAETRPQQPAISLHLGALSAACLACACRVTDGVYFKPRMAEEKQCVLVVVGAPSHACHACIAGQWMRGRKELLAMADGFRESTQSPLSHMQACVAGQRDASCCSISSGLA